MKTEYSFGLSWIIIPTVLLICWSTGMEIIEPRGISTGVKRHTEFELSLFTEMLGFVDDDHQQTGTAWNKIITQYVAYSRTGTTHLAVNTKITKKYFGDTQTRERLCRAYLEDEIFHQNGIHYQEAENEHSFLYELKLVRLHYFSRTRDELVKVVGCPIWWNRGGVMTHLYFQEILIHHYLNPWSIGRGYFVFANMQVQQIYIQPLELLMFTLTTNKQLPPLPEEASEEADLYDATNVWRPDAPRFKLRALDKSQIIGTAGLLYSFGGEAELHFLSKTYRFINMVDSQWMSTPLVSILDRMEKGYEVDRRRMNEVRDNKDTATTCFNYITYNPQLGNENIIFRSDLIGDNIDWVKKSVRFRLIHISGSREYELLRCPIEEFRERYFLYILPVHYRNPNKAPQVFTFLEPEGMEDESIGPNEVFPFIFSEVNQHQFRKPEKAKQISPTGVFGEGSTSSNPFGLI